MRRADKRTAATPFVGQKVGQRQVPPGVLHTHVSRFVAEHVAVTAVRASFMVTRGAVVWVHALSYVFSITDKSM